MAQDGYPAPYRGEPLSSSSSSQQTPFFPNLPGHSTNSNGHGDNRMSYSQSSFHSIGSDHSNGYKSHSRQSSRDRGSDGPAAASTRHRPEHLLYTQPRDRPINEAVESAFDTVETPINPELIAQITQNVIQQLRTSGVDTGTPRTAVNAYPPPPPPQQQQPPSQPTLHHPQRSMDVPLSPATTTSDISPSMPSRNVYTPPSPHKHTDFSTFDSPDTRAGRAFESQPSPKPREPSISRVAFEEERRPSSRVSMSSESGVSRPKGPTRLSTATEETTLEKIWGTLFDSNGVGTTRLSQFLRGLATHIIEDYEPKHSLVITPDKMVKYYQIVKLSNEVYPWDDVFDDHESNISRMLRELECRHHLVQDQPGDRPDIPGLTPHGFERWSTLLILAHPEEEFDRLKKAVQEMPISNPDDRKERFPKDISRRLFPKSDDRRIRGRLRRAMNEHCHLNLQFDESPSPPTTARQADPAPRPRSPRHNSTASIHSDTPSFTERERAPYSSVANESAIDDTNVPTPIPQPIERERKPYAAQPGGGRLYEDGDTNPPLTARSNVPPPPPPMNQSQNSYSSTTSTNTATSSAIPIPNASSLNPSLSSSNSGIPLSQSQQSQSIPPPPPPQQQQSQQSSQPPSSYIRRSASMASNRPPHIAPPPPSSAALNQNSSSSNNPSNSNGGNSHQGPEIHHYGRAPVGMNGASNSGVLPPPPQTARRRRSPSYSAGSDYRRSEPELRTYPSNSDHGGVSLSNSGYAAWEDDNGAGGGGGERSRRTTTGGGGGYGRRGTGGDDDMPNSAGIFGGYGLQGSYGGGGGGGGGGRTYIVPGPGPGADRRARGNGPPPSGSSATGGGDHGGLGPGYISMSAGAREQQAMDEEWYRGVRRDEARHRYP